MRHLFVTNDFPPKRGGIESYVTTLCKGFPPEDVVVLAPAREGHEEVDEALPYQVVRVPGSYLRAKRGVREAIVQTVERHEADIVHYLAALPLGSLGPRVREATSTRYTVVAHGSGEILVPARLPLARRALRNVLREADLVLPVSEFTREAVGRVTKGRARTYVLPPSVDTERFSLEVSGASARIDHQLGGRFVVLFVSRLVKRKGADMLIRAVASLKEPVALIVGDGPERKALERLTREIGATDRVIFAGGVGDEELPGYYAAADVFCMPCTTRYGGLDTEGFGIVYLEAQASGLPCIAGRCGGSAEAVEHGVSGIVIDEPTPRRVALAIRRLTKDPALSAKLGAAGRDRAERQFSPAVAARRLEEALAASSSVSDSAR